MKKFCLIAVLVLVLGPGASFAGIYSKPSDDPTNPYDAPISKSDAAILEWANVVIDYSPAPGVDSSYQNPETGYGSLGDLTHDQVVAGVAPGSITLGFDTGIGNKAGADFAVFENGFAYGSPNGVFMELAFVEVSTNGNDFARFEAVSTNTAPVGGSGGFSGWDSTNVFNLAGKNKSGWGTPFDLDQLASHALVGQGLLDLGNIQFVRLVDIPGTGDYLDSLGNPILDAHPTKGSGGFDFRLTEGIAVLNGAASVPVPGTASLLFAGLMALTGLGRKTPRP